MAIDLTLKSVAITNRDATPRVMNNPGQGASGQIRSVRSHLASVTASLSATSVIRMVSVPSTARVISVIVDSEAQAAGKFNVGVYRTPTDGGLVAASNADSFFTTDLDCASAVINQQCVLKATSRNTIAKMNQPLWQAIGMAADPKTDLDVCLTVHTTDVTTGLGAVQMHVTFVV